MKIFKWIKNHPAEAAAIAAGLVLTGGAAGIGPAAAMMAAPAVGAGAAGAAGAGAVGGSLAGASAAAGADAAAIAAANAAAAGGGEAVSGAALGHLAGSGVGVPFAGESALLAGLPMTEYGLGGAGEMSSLLAQYAAPSADPMLLGGNTPLGSPYSGWWDKATATVGDKLKDPKTVMRLGMQVAQMGAPRQQGGPMGAQFEQPAMRSALRSQEDITKAWLLHNDPNTYRRIYGNPQPQGVA